MSEAPQGQGPPWKGQGKELHAALEDAWGNAQRDNAPPGRYVVQSIEVECTNPISTYHVTIAPGGG